MSYVGDRLQGAPGNGTYGVGLFGVRELGYPHRATGQDRTTIRNSPRNSIHNTRRPQVRPTQCEGTAGAPKAGPLCGGLEPTLRESGPNRPEGWPD